MRAILVGLGGIGTHLVEPLSRTLVFSKSQNAPKRLILIDGDAYEPKNRQRQRFIEGTNKAEATRELLAPLFPELEIEAKPHYIDGENIFLFIKEKDIVFLAVDKHVVRKLVSDHAATLNDVLVISGGNELYDGNIQIFERQDGKEITHPLTYLHPEIAFPKDKNPAELSCEELAAEEGGFQLLSVNFSIAAMMLNAFTLWLEKNKFSYYEQYFDLLTGNMRSVKMKQA